MAHDVRASRAPRLHLAGPLAAGKTAALSAVQTNYLANVLRLGAGAWVLAFNGRDGEFLAEINAAGRKALILALTERMRAPEAPPDLDFLFAPLKHARLDYLAQKAVEMGAGRLRPILTRRTQVGRLNLERLEANAIEAAEQCGAVWTPRILPLEPLERTLAAWPAERVLVFCDEDGPAAGPLDALRELKADQGVGLLIGPEGGFDEPERTAILRVPRVVRLRLGPRVLRADTAAVAALALVQAALGDWREGVKPVDKNSRAMLPPR
jgi:16S rRNA (uracil1498-N3)-methyltransferase